MRGGNPHFQTLEMMALNEGVYLCVFEVKKEEFTNKTFRVPVNLLKRLEFLAQNEKVSLNNLVIQCCEYALNNMKKS